jgi:hypothetical protein
MGAVVGTNGSALGLMSLMAQSGHRETLLCINGAGLKFKVPIAI